MIYPGWNFALYAAWLLVTLCILLDKEGRNRIFRVEIPLWRQTLYGVLLAVGLLALVGAINLIAAGQFSLFQFTRLDKLGMADFLLFQLLVAVTEESFFRGFLMDWSRQRGVPSVMQVLGTALLFGGMHWIFNRDGIQLAMATGIGLVFAAAYSRGKGCTVYSLMLAHFLYDIAIINL